MGYDRIAMGLKAAEEFRFGPFRLLPNQAVLLKGDRPVRLGSRALDILILLARNAGRLLTKQDIMETVWPDTIVVEANLSVHMAALRRVLEADGVAEKYIVTIPGRGYQFVAPVDAMRSDPAYAVSPSSRSNLPLLLTRLIGRDSILRDITSHLARHRLLTIVGSGGVGKTTLALNVAESQLSRWGDGVWLVDFAPFSDPELVPAALATVLGLEVRSKNPIPALTSALRDKEILLVFDNCDHLLEPVAALAHAILQSAGSTRILATSREPLTIPGEAILRLDPLEVPPELMPVGAREALTYPAVQLLNERAQAIMTEFELTDQDALAASLICRKLGGVPLAIEFASALIPAFGVAGLSARLDDRLRLLQGGRRSALPRHRTLTAALDWSYQLLDPIAQLVLRRLSIFAGGFTVEAAMAVLPAQGETFDIAGIIADLVLKSLVTPDIRENQSRFRLLETTRAFALNLLAESFEAPDLERRHAEYFARALNGDTGGHSARQDHASFMSDLDNIRLALRWAMSDRGDAELAAAIGAGALPVWFGLSLLTECGARMRELFGKLDQSLRESANGQAIHVAITSTEIFTLGAADASYREWALGQSAAEAKKDSRERVRLLAATWTFNIRLPDYAAADEQSKLFAEIAGQSNSFNLKATASWMRGTTLHHMGQLGAAKRLFERFLREETPEFRAFWMTTTGFDRRSDTFGLLGLTKCLQGDAEQGLRDADTGIAEARSTRKALALCEALQWSVAAKLIAAAPVRTISPEVDELNAASEQHSLSSHLGMALCFKGCEHSLQGKHKAAVEYLEKGLDTLKQARYGPFDPLFVGVLATAQAAGGEVRAGLRSIDRFELRQDDPTSFGLPDFLRRKARLLMLIGSLEKAEALFRQAQDIAREQGSAVWHLRSATDLAELLYNRNRSGEAITGLRQAVEAAPGSLRGPHRKRARDLLVLWGA